MMRRRTKPSYRCTALADVYLIAKLKSIAEAGLRVASAAQVVNWDGEEEKRNDLRTNSLERI